MKIKEYDCIYYNQSRDFVRPPLHDLGRTIKTDNHPIAVIVKDNDMEQEKKSINLPPELEGKKFRIRKLTPKECFRLMGVDDVDINKIQAAGISNSAQYKLAGNSIVVDVLYHQFVKAFIAPEQEMRRGTELTLF